MDNKKPYNRLIAENKELELQLAEAKDTIEAIRNGQVDALVVKGKNGHQLFTLKNADQTYRVFIEKMAEGAVTLNRDSIILYSNTRFSRMMSLPLEKVIGVHFESFVEASSVSKYRELIKTGWKNDCKDEILFLSSRMSEPKLCLMSCNTLELDDGVALSIIITDLTLQKDAQKQLRLKNDQLEEARANAEKLNDELEQSVKKRTQELFDSREHFKILADNVPQMTWTNLPNGEVNFYNHQWYKYTGLSFEESKGQGWLAVIHPDDKQETQERFMKALRSEKAFVMENRYKRQDGMYRWHLNRGVPLRNEDGEITLWIGTATDIDDQKREMEKKDEFIGIASHELKTPLTSLKGYLHLITSYKKDTLPPAVTLFSKKATDSVNKLQYLVNDLLDVSKINAGKLEYQMSVINLAELIKSCIENANHIYPDYEIRNNGEAQVLVKGNMERLEQVLMNLLNNAVKYSRDNKLIIVSTAASGNKVKVAITDFGIGLSDSQKNKIFERFYRVEDKKFLSSGLGMGLYICTEIIKAHNGNIAVESQLGAGSTFYFVLPMV
jgi:two-component system CheB/CheR fusion protein